jgi:hypothetical protein
MDFRDSIINNVAPRSDVTTGAKAAYAVDMGIKAMDTEETAHWDDANYIL